MHKAQCFQPVCWKLLCDKSREGQKCVKDKRFKKKARLKTG